MIDSGCNTILLPIPNGDVLREMVKNFPMDRYSWNISHSAGASALSCPILTITPLVGTVLVELAKDCRICQSQVPFLRFHVCYEDANTMFKENFGVLNREALDTFVQTVDAARSSVPQATIGERRSYALLGQQFLGQAHLITIQLRDILMVMESEAAKDLSVFDISRLVQTLTTKCESLVQTKFGKEFDDLEDEDHDSDDTSGYVLRGDMCIDDI
jgi:hypothetical protein